jgi:hypothetical protein
LFHAWSSSRLVGSLVAAFVAEQHAREDGQHDLRTSSIQGVSEASIWVSSAGASPRSVSLDATAWLVHRLRKARERIEEMRVKDEAPEFQARVSAKLA